MKSLLFSTFFLISFVTFNQDLNNLTAPTKVTTISYFNKNDFKKYRIDHSQSVKKDDAPAELSKTAYDMSIKVIDSTLTSYKFQLIYSNYTLPATTQEFEKELMTCFKDMKIIYTTNENGEFQKFENIPEIKVGVKKMLDLIKKKFTSTLKDEKAKKQFEMTFASFEKVMQNDQNIENMFNEDILFLHGMYGIELKLKEAQEFEIEFPLLNDIVVKGTAVVTLTEINKDTKITKFVVKESANPGEIEKNLSAMMQEMSGNTAGDFDVTKFKVDSKTNQTYFMFLDSGWMKKITSTTTQDINYEEHKVKKIISKEYTLIN